METIFEGKKNHILNGHFGYLNWSYHRNIMKYPLNFPSLGRTGPLEMVGFSGEIAADESRKWDEFMKIGI